MINCGAGSRIPSHSAADKYQRVPHQHPVAETRGEESRQCQRQARNQQPDGARRETEREAAARPASGADWFGMEGSRDHLNQRSLIPQNVFHFLVQIIGGCVDQLSVSLLHQLPL